MRRILVVLAVVSIALGLKPSIKTAIRNQVMVDLKNAVVPLIAKEVALVVMPDLKFHLNGFDVHISQIIAGLLPVDPNQIALQFLPGTSMLLVGGAGLTMGGKAHIQVKFKFVTKTTNVEILVRNLGFAFEVSMLSANNKLIAVVAKTVIHLSKNDIIIRIPDPFFAFIIEIFKEYFLGIIIKDLEGRLPKSVNNKLLKILLSLPTDIDIGSGLSMKYGFPYAPFYKEGYLYIGVGGYVHPKNSPSPPPFEPPDVPEFDHQNPKGIQFFISDYVIKSALDAEFRLGTMTASFEKAIGGHSLKVQCKATKVPNLRLANAIVAELDSECDVFVDNKPNYLIGVASRLHASVSEHVRSNLVFFKINELKLLTIEFKKIPPYDIEWFKNRVNEVLAVIIELINVRLSQKGIPLPHIPEMEFRNTIGEVRNGYIEIGVDPVFHITQDANTFSLMID
eukprot:TRINITY_DN1690_c0_g1_i1.p1 TRINITY_DN1690_c0_g1~~TRINITY_DN1690_c0_g1_i1.p1  ORF type:complete len:496 (+),score=42.37 TRINITY_DN1690_c0_g1_i1:136-1488(+)